MSRRFTPGQLVVRLSRLVDPPLSTVLYQYTRPDGGLEFTGNLRSDQFAVVVAQRVGGNGLYDVLLLTSAAQLGWTASSYLAGAFPS